MRIKQTVIGIAIVAGLLGLAGCQRIDPKAEAQIRPAVAESQDKGKKQKSTFTCAGKTKAGERCKRHVKNDGDFCWQHAKGTVSTHAGHWDCSRDGQKLVEFSTKAEAEKACGN